MLDPKTPNEDENKKFPGYPHYESDEDIYAQEKKVPDERAGQTDEGSPEDASMDVGLDVPGAELDDEQESVGSEDEENNYYSLGGENHEDLEERDDTL